MPSSPHPKPGTVKEVKKTLTPGRRDAVTKPKSAGKVVQKESAVAAEADYLHEDVELQGAVGGELPPQEATFKKLPKKGVETGQFVRRAPAEIKPVAFRPELSPRSKKVHNSACRYFISFISAKLKSKIR